MTTASYDVGAALVIGALIIVPAGLLRLSEARLRHAAILWLLGWAVGIASLYGRRRNA